MTIEKFIKNIDMLKGEVHYLKLLVNDVENLSDIEAIYTYHNPMPNRSDKEGQYRISGKLGERMKEMYISGIKDELKEAEDKLSALLKKKEKLEVLLDE